MEICQKKNCPALAAICHHRVADSLLDCFQLLAHGGCSNRFPELQPRIRNMEKSVDWNAGVSNGIFIALFLAAD